MSKPKITVFGKSGQLGSALHALSQSDGPFEIKVVGRPEGDLTNHANVRNLLLSEKPVGIINAAAYTAVDDAETDEARAFKLNAEAPHWLATFAKELAIPLIHISTDYVFDGSQDTPYRPEDDIAPINAYGRSKLAGEWGCLGAHPAMTYVIRTSWVYSEWGSNFVKTMLKLGESRDSLSVVHDQVGSPTYAMDLAQACIHMVQKIIQHEVNAPGIYHYTNAGACSWYEFAEEIFKFAPPMSLTKTSSDQFPRPAKRPQYSKLDSRKLGSTFGLKIRPWQEALHECMKNLKVTA